MAGRRKSNKNVKQNKKANKKSELHSTKGENESIVNEEEKTTTQSVENKNQDVLPIEETKDVTGPELKVEEETEPKAMAKEETEPKLKTKGETETMVKEETETKAIGKDVTEPKLNVGEETELKAKEETESMLKGDDNKDSNSTDPVIVDDMNDEKVKDYVEGLRAYRVAFFTPEQKDKIKKQLEYYFSDVNFARDNFLRETSQKNEGFIDITVLLTFNRLRTLEANVHVIKEVMENSPLVILKGDAIKKVETPEYLAYLADKEINKRTVCIKGFPVEFVLEDIQKILCNPIPCRISMKRNVKKEFQGKCIVEYASEEDANKVLNDVIVANKSSEDSESKRQKLTPILLEVVSMDEYLSSKPSSPKETKKQKEISKIKKDFKTKIYSISGLEEETKISEVKKEIPHVAYVDLKNEVVRMKHIEDWEEKEFGKFTLKKLNEEEADEYLKKIDIRPIKEKK